MLLAVNATLYVFALAIAVLVTRPAPGTSTRGGRAARWTLALGGGLTIVAAIVLASADLWFESALAGTASIVVVAVSMWCAFAQMHAVQETEDEDDDDDDGGSMFRKPPPEPTRPEGDPADDLWADFDKARAGWSRDREPAGT
jgi:predicted phage tail protein